MCYKYLIACLAVTVYCSAWAEIMVTQPVSTILKNLQNQGFVAVERLQLQGDQYLAEALNSKGDAVSIALNSHSGEITSLKKLDAHLPMLDVVAKAEAVGYTGITSIQSEDDAYEIIAIGPQGDKTHLKVNAITGAIDKVPLR